MNRRKLECSCQEDSVLANQLGGSRQGVTAYELTKLKVGVAICLVRTLGEISECVCSICKYFVFELFN